MAYSIALAKFLNLKSIWVWSWTSRDDPGWDYWKHTAIKYRGKLYDYHGLTNIQKIRKDFGSGKLVRVSLVAAVKQYHYKSILKKAEKLVREKW